jgi:KDO2-lipid IV(A) lauroyltransferase
MLAKNTPPPGPGPRISAVHRLLLQSGRWIGRLAHLLDASHRRVVRQNLRFTHPQWPAERIRRMTRGVFENIGATLMEILWITRLDRRGVLDGVLRSGEAHVQNALDRGRGLILISAHLGNWEMALQYASCYFRVPVHVVAKPLRFKPLQDWIHRFRSRFGARIIYKQGSLAELAKALGRREVVCLLVDQSRRSEGLEVTYFGRRVATTPAVAMLALRYRSPVLPVFCVRDSAGALWMRADPPLEILRTGDLKADLLANTQRVTDAVERAVRRTPEQWFWVHKRWKKFYPQLYPEYRARRARRRSRAKGGGI